MINVKKFSPLSHYSSVSKKKKMNFLLHGFHLSHYSCIGFWDFR